MLFKEEKTYLALANDIIENGSSHKDRTGVGTKALFGKTMEFDLTDGKIPMLSTRKVPIRFMPIELVWFISGDTNLRFLLENNVNIWNSWVIPETAKFDSDPQNFLQQLAAQNVIKLDENYKDVFKALDTTLVNSTVAALTGKPVPGPRLISGSIGDGAYGAQWRKWEDIRLISTNATEDEHDDLLAQGYVDINDEIYPGLVTDTTPAFRVMRKRHDQLQNVIDQINNNENSRRILVSAWNAGRLDQMALPPCHTLFQFNVRRGDDGTKYLTCNLYCRSQDLLVGTVANIAQYSMLTHMIAQVTGCVAEKLIWFGSNVHIYDNQIELALDHLQRMPMRNQVKLVLNKDIKNIDDFRPDDIQITGYDNFLPPIKYPVAV